MEQALPGVDIPKLRRLWKGVVVWKPETLAAKYEALQELIRLPGETPEEARNQARTLLYRNYRVLSIDTRTLTARTDTLAAMLGIERARAIRLVRSYCMIMYQDPETLSHKLDALKNELKVDLDQARRIGVKHPPILWMKSETLASRIRDLQCILPDANVRKLVTKAPTLMSISQAKLAQKLTALKRLLPMSDSEVGELVVGNKAMLSYKIESVQIKYDLLLARVARVDRWQDDLARYKPVTFGRLLSASLERQERLEALAALPSPHRDQTPLMSVLSWTEAEFVVRYQKLRDAAEADGASDRDTLVSLS